MSRLGYGQTWQNVIGSRALGTTYYNTTGKPITVLVNATSASATPVFVTVNGLQMYGTTPVAASQGSQSVVVPPGGSYVAGQSGGTVSSWSELR